MVVVRALFSCILGPKSKGWAVGTWPGPPGTLGIWCHKGPIKLTLSRKVVVVGVSWKSDHFVIDWTVLYLQKQKKIVDVFLNFQNGKFQMVFLKKQMIWPIVSNFYLLYICVLLLWMEEEREREWESKLHWLWKTLPLGKQLLVHTRYIPLKKSWVN